jgi:hypothetical protein
MSGYKQCACRDCMEIAIGDDEENALCVCCEEAGCSPNGDEECHALDLWELVGEAADEADREPKN